MKFYLLTFSLFVCSLLFGQKDYTIEINDQVYDVTLTKIDFSKQEVICSAVRTRTKYISVIQISRNKI